MIVGQIDMDGLTVQTHRHSYLLHNLSVVSVSRPFLPFGVIFAIGGLGFIWAFRDLLYPAEIITIGVLAAFALWIGIAVGQIQFLSRDLKGTELSSVIYGTYHHLNRIRLAIAKAVAAQHAGLEVSHEQ